MLAKLRSVVDIWNKARVGSHGAATAYYAVFSLAPVLLIAIGVAGLIFGAERAQTQILDQFGGTFGSDTRAFLESLLSSRHAQTRGWIATVVGAVLVLIGGSGIFTTLRTGLDEVFETLPPKPAKGFAGSILRQVISFGMVFAVGFLLLASLLVSTALTAVAAYAENVVPQAKAAVGVLDIGLSYALISIFLAGLLNLLPSERIGWTAALKGGFLAGLLFIAGKQALGAYFALAHPENPFGAASAIVLVILWSYYLSLALFFSAIILRVFFIRAHIPAVNADTAAMLSGYPGSVRQPAQEFRKV